MLKAFNILQIMKKYIKLSGYLLAVLSLTILIAALFITASNFFQYSDLNEVNLKKNIKPDDVTPIKYISKTSPIPVTLIPTSATYPTVIKKPAASDDGQPWGVAKKIGEHTYTIKLGKDDRMGNPNEIYEALNNYRNQLNKGYLAWDEKLANLAQKRADHFKSIKNTDEHAGLNDYLDNQNGFIELGFNQIGENSYFGTPLYGVHLIEWLFASSAEHNSNQLDHVWSHVGIGANDTAVNIIFGGGKM